MDVTHPAPPSAGSRTRTTPMPPGRMPETPAPATERTLLLVSALFPPWMEVGAARWEGFTPYLLEAGWSLEVLMQAPPPGTKLDPARRERLGPAVRTTMVERRDPAWRVPALKVANLLRGRRYVPEPVEVTVTANERLEAAPKAFSPGAIFGAAVGAARERQWIDALVARSRSLPPLPSGSVVVSSGPPHEAHVAASRIAAAMHAPHVLDLRDPWVGNPGHQGALSWLASPLDASSEQQVFAAARAVIANTPAAAEVLATRYPALRGRIHTILNGTDRAAAPPRTLAPGEDFVIVHTGTLYLDRDPRPFFRAVAAARRALGPAAPQLRLVFMGHRSIVAGRPLSDWVAEYGIGDCFEERPFGTREAATQLMRSAAMLVAFQGATPTQVPAKLFDYASNAATILALTDPASATASILAGTSARVAPLSDEAAITAHVVDAVQRAAAGEPITAVDADGRYARSRQAATLLQVLDSLG